MAQYTTTTSWAELNTTELPASHDTKPRSDSAFFFDSKIKKRLSHLQRKASARSGTIFSEIRTTETQRVRLSEERAINVFFPWSKYYKAWWGFTVAVAFCNIFTETYEIAFSAAGLSDPKGTPSIIEIIVVVIFAIDMGVTFNLAFYNDNHDIIYHRRVIARRYMRFMFWIDLIAVFPFYAIALACAGEFGQNTSLAEYLSLLKLTRMVQLYRVKQFFEVIQYSSKISLLSLTFIRNFAAAMVWTHFSACTMFFLARQYSFDDNTWIGNVDGMTTIERYLTSLYWAVTTFTTVRVFQILLFVCTFCALESVFF